jgi:hypothetical protein
VSDFRKERRRSLPENPEMAGFSGLRVPLERVPDQLDTERAVRLLDESVSGFERIADAVRAAATRLNALNDQIASAAAMPPPPGVDPGAVATYLAGVQRVAQAAAAFEHDLEALRRDTAGHQAFAEAARTDASGLSEAFARIVTERDELACDYQEMRAEYERLAREAIVLRGESLAAFVRRKWTTLFRSSPPRSE